MRLQLIALSILVSFSVFANDEKELKDLFKKYYQVVNEHKVELVDEVFSQKFLKGDGGKEAFIKKVKEHPSNTNKSKVNPDISFKKGVMDEMYFVKMNPVSAEKNKKESHSSEFIVVKEDGKLKIEGTISDSE